MRKHWVFVVILLLGIGLWAAPACAMHISEGILPIDWASLWFLVAAPFVYGDCGPSGDVARKIPRP